MHMNVWLHTAENCPGSCDQPAQQLDTGLSLAPGAAVPGGPDRGKGAARGAKVMPSTYILPSIPGPKLPLLQCLF